MSPRLDLCTLPYDLYGARVLTNDQYLVDSLLKTLIGDSPIRRYVYEAMRDLEKHNLRAEILLIVFSAEDGTLSIRALPGPHMLDLRVLDAPGTVKVALVDVENEIAGRRA
jgi:hypothetical protein